MTKLFNNKIKNIGQIMSLESKANVVGSASIKRSIYYSDYDLFESVNNKSSAMVYNHFKAVFNIIKSSPNVVVSDFKCGHGENGKPLRWDFSEINAGVNNGVTFEEALEQKSIIKIDIIALVSSRFVEISEVYNIKIKGSTNMDYSKENVIKNIVEEYKDMVKGGNFMKSLKKMYSIIRLKDPNDKTLNLLLDYFNSPIGLLYRCKADLETIEMILNYTKFSIEAIKESLQTLKEQISAFR